MTSAQEPCSLHTERGHADPTDESMGSHLNDHQVSDEQMAPARLNMHLPTNDDMVEQEGMISDDHHDGKGLMASAQEPWSVVASNTEATLNNADAEVFGKELDSGIGFIHLDAD